MNLNEVLFNIGERSFTIAQVLYALASMALVIITYWILVRKLFRQFLKFIGEEPDKSRRILNAARILFIQIIVLGILWGVELDYLIWENENVEIRISSFIIAILVLQLTIIFNWMVSGLIRFYYARYRFKDQDEDTIAESLKDLEYPRTSIRLIFYSIAGILILQAFQINYTLFTYQKGDINVDFRISSLFRVVIILFAARLVIWILTELILHAYYRQKNINVGARYAANQLLTYVLYVVAILYAMESLGIQMTVIWGGAAALLVGVGLGLQQTFNDLISGIIILFERTVEVGDIVELDTLVGKVKRIGLRTSLVETRENITVVVPNSKLINETVINWSHMGHKARFKVSVGVAYGSDTELVKRLLLECAQSAKKVATFPTPFVRFVDFGNSSLDFEILFWSNELMRIEDVQSEIRFKIDQAFREHGVTIPFPQRDVWMRDH